jgi:hypothetical protein
MSVTQEPMFSDRAVATVVREVDAAAQRVMDHMDEEKKSSGCDACGHRRSPIRPGHIYLLIGCFMFLAIAAIGAVGK